MAWANSGSTYHSNAIPGSLQGADGASIYDIDSTAKFALGSGFTRQDGNKYRYANFITATTQGLLVSQDRSDVTNVSTNALITAPAATYQMPNEITGVYPGSLGSRYVLVTLASVVAGQFAGGYLSLGIDTGYGYMYRIRGNTATDNPASGLIRLELYEPLAVAVSTDTDCAIIGSIYNDLRAATAATDNIVVGVTCANMTANTYGWVCTHGVCTCLQDGTVTNGDMIQISIVTAGAFSAYGVGTSSNSQLGGVGNMFGAQALGFCIDTAATTNYSVIYLQIE